MVIKAASVSWQKRQIKMNPGILYNEPKNYEAAVVLDQQLPVKTDAQNENAIIDQFLSSRALADIERRAIIATIRACNGNKAASARSLGISEKSIYNKMKRLQISNADLYGTPPAPQQAATPIHQSALPQAPTQQQPAHGQQPINGQQLIGRPVGHQQPQPQVPPQQQAPSQWRPQQ